MSKELLFSVTIKDCDVQTFRSGGHGGQNVDKVSSGVRIAHNASGAVGQARDTRDQLKNKRLAFQRMAESERFKTWHKQEVAKKLNTPTIKEKSGSGNKGFGAAHIRTYTLSGKRVIKDSRTGHVRFDVDTVMNGDLDSFIQAFLR